MATAKAKAALTCISDTVQIECPRYCEAFGDGHEVNDGDSEDTRYVIDFADGCICPKCQVQKVVEQISGGRDGGDHAEA